MSKTSVQISKNIKDAVKVLKDNGVVVMPTDTIYGMLGKALSKTVVGRIYTIRKRDPPRFVTS